jgi:hypothetical protein
MGMSSKVAIFMQTDCCEWPSVKWLAPTWLFPHVICFYNTFSTFLISVCFYSIAFYRVCNLKSSSNYLSWFLFYELLLTSSVSVVWTSILARIFAIFLDIVFSRCTLLITFSGHLHVICHLQEQSLLHSSNLIWVSADSHRQSAVMDIVEFDVPCNPTTVADYYFMLLVFSHNGITLFRFVTVFCGTNNILHNIPEYSHIQSFKSFENELAPINL